MRAAVMCGAAGVAAMVSVALGGCRQRACELPHEEFRQFDLSRTNDRARLASEIASARLVAARYGSWAAAHAPDGSGYADTVLVGQHALAYCTAILNERIAQAHGLSPDVLDEFDSEGSAHQGTQ